ncbi:unnamed protein product [Ambrosiozyma monospora]|uniref:Unnamed protein product n=1 Tax=Ambrosiozyma monospora TaxID=43982 RepID=A0ACB5TKT0_AMBMO|nr:unnamed protein product [Ambrosiozyma monospora]
MISKFVAAVNQNLTINSKTKRVYSKDIAGYECILARHEDSGELYTPSHENFAKTLMNPSKFAQNQLFFALSPNYPMINSDIQMTPPRNNQFEQTFPSHILADFKTVVGKSVKVPQGYAGMTAFMYLRNSKKRLTEAFSIQIDSDHDLLLDNLSAALFKNVPANEIDTGRIYLVALLTETINLDQVPNTHAVGGSRSGVPNLHTIRKGVCAGAVDISRVFSRRKGHLKSGQAHEFVMQLYASYMTDEAEPMTMYPGMNPLLAMSMAMQNKGWGELVDRIISGSNKGIAKNPRAEKLIIQVKELQNNSFTGNELKHNGIDMIKTMVYNPIESDYDHLLPRH